MHRVLGRGSVFILVVTGTASALFGQVTRVGDEFQVNSYTSSLQAKASVAVDGNGGFVVAWTSARDGSQDVFARRFAASGAAVATEFLVNTYTPASQLTPAVAAGVAGDFIVAWRGDNEDGSGTGIFARRWSSAGVAQATEFQVNSYTPGNQSSPAVALGIAGDFLVVWQSAGGQDGSQYGVFARHFASTGSPLATELQVNTYFTSDQTAPTVAAGIGGDFAVAWRSVQTGFYADIFARRLDSSGNPIASEFQVNVITVNDQSFPSIAIDGNGDFIVVWNSFGQDGSAHGVFGRRFDASGVPLAADFQVNSYVINPQEFAEVRADGDGDFVVSWESALQDGSSYGVFARRFDSTGTAQAAEFRVNNHTPEAQRYPSVGMAPNGDFVVAWESNLQDGSESGIFAQRFSVSPKVFDIDDNGAVAPLTDGLLFLRYFFGFRGDTLINGAVAANCARCTALPVESYLAGLGAVALAKKAGPELQVNSYTAGDQRAAAAAAEANGDFVLAWQSGHDGSEVGIFARRFDGTGAPLAGEVLVNQYITGSQTEPEVAMDADGDFVVVWQSNGQDGSGQGIFARGFNSAGIPQAAEFQVNTSTVDAQQRPAVAMDAGGDFVIAWGSYPQYAYPDVFARRFNASLSPLATEFRVNATIDLSQTSPAVAMLSNGAFVVAWRFYGIWARRFDSSGSALSGDFKVNTFSNESQSDPDIAVDGAGGFVVTWQNNQDGSAHGAFGRRFDSAGVAQGGEFHINAFTSDEQGAAVVRRIGSGEFVVTWASGSQDGQAGGVFARRFNAAGLPQATELQVNKFTIGQQDYPSLGMDSSGDFVVAWESAAQDGSGFGVFAQRFAASHPADIDGDGAIAALTDGLLFLRYLFGFRDATLITGAVGLNCTRCTAPAIEAYIAARV